MPSDPLPIRILVTGANGSGKSHAAARLQKMRPDLPLVGFDALKLTTNWERRGAKDVQADLATVIGQDRWILEGGPSLLRHALPRAQAVLWLDPPTYLRAWRLAVRPWRNRGRTRAELPDGNVDWPLQQYRFAFQSLRNTSKFRTTIAESLDRATGVSLAHCRNDGQVDEAIARWSEPKEF